MAEILASLDDINANLPSDSEVPTVVATDDNTALIQISVARIVRGCLSRVLDPITLASWGTPETTPDTIREIAGKLIASQLYFNKTAEQSTVIEDNSFAQRRYDEAIALLNQIIAGTIVIPNIPVISTEGLTLDDGFPIDDTDRAFTMGQLF